MKRFENKVVLVTGGSSGIGLAIAERLREEGGRVFTAQRSHDSEFESIQADFSCLDDARRVVEALVAQTGGLDVLLVNNAGMMQESSVEQMSFEDWQRSLMVNLNAPFLLIKAALPYLRINKGNIVNIGSIEGLGSNPVMPPIARLKQVCTD